MVNLENFVSSVDYQGLVAAWPQLRDVNEYWHAYYMATEPATFMKWVTDTGPTLPNEKEWYAALKDILKRSVTDQFVQEQIAANQAVGEPFLVAMYPEWGEWYQSYRIQYNLEDWIKGALAFQENNISDPDTRKKYIADVKRLLKAYAPDNWQERLDDETRNEFIRIFMRDEIMAAEAAQIELEAIKNKKVIGIAVFGAIGLVLASNFLGKAKKR